MMSIAYMILSVFLPPGTIYAIKLNNCIGSVPCGDKHKVSVHIERHKLVYRVIIQSRLSAEFIRSTNL